MRSYLASRSRTKQRSTLSKSRNFTPRSTGTLGTTHCQDGNPPGEDGCPAFRAEISGTSDSEGTESREAKSVEKTGGSHEDSGNSGEIMKDRSPVVVLDEDSDSDDDAFYDAISFDGDDGDEDSQEVVEAEPSTGTSSDRLLLPVRRLEKEYERCMQMSAEELSLEPAVYIHEGSELLAQLRDELAMLPELQELSPECDIMTWMLEMPSL
ncbi:unnamed protein product [Phytophthora fragariaefolia]|uniref:Unnamed protein product n=1 Tax=Phytophthora fragariaefolia TaxID=1490495 RepID=A0A9W7D6S0_9STRA|nr:unnamed protein product [Phytophthora fragariaefolia]